VVVGDGNGMIGTNWDKLSLFAGSPFELSLPD